MRGGNVCFVYAKRQPIGFGCNPRIPFQLNGKLWATSLNNRSLDGAAAGAAVVVFIVLQVRKASETLGKPGLAARRLSL